MSTQNGTEIQIIIEMDNDGRYCSCFPVVDKKIAEKMVARYKAGRQGYLHNYKIETHHMG